MYVSPYLWKTSFAWLSPRDSRRLVTLNAAPLAPRTSTVPRGPVDVSVYSPSGSVFALFTVKLNGTLQLTWPAWLGEAAAVNTAISAAAHSVLTFRFVMGLSLLPPDDGDDWRLPTLVQETCSGRVRARSPWCNHLPPRARSALSAL